MIRDIALNCPTLFRSRKLWRIRRILIFVFIVALLLFVLSSHDEKSFAFDVTSGNRFITVFSDDVWRNKTTKKILVWTTFFDSWEWYDDGNSCLNNSCPFKCEVTNDKFKITESDAVLFHPNDVWKYKGIPSYLYQSYVDMPRYRSRDQVWIWYSMEPPIFLWGESKPNIFNWTMSFRRDSTIKMPYGTMREMTDEEKQKLFHESFEFGTNRKKMAVTLISNCYDQAHRYRLINELQKHGLETEVLGKCGLGKICTEFENAHLNYNCMQDHLGRYKFYIAIENSFCRDYITEKFWLSLSRNQVPIVAWKFPAVDIVPPRSYINIFDFPSLKSAAEYIVSVSKNDTLYKSYFVWKRRYKIGGDLCNFCKVCKELHTKRPAQVYNDLEGWLRQDTCKKTGLKTLISTILSRMLYDLGLG
ncbi:hypothetical protein CHS0354_004919 [Potamilus streckersoni]|uniref:Fucosyltransferase n=1 Tax=Potamilus streckersoni TaxID=2493646 RepID=A0AAE0TJ00_9BIVA|nr:hypothetical protein CHS0354_004919 [Potamilus streckersoni]